MTGPPYFNLDRIQGAIIILVFFGTLYLALEGDMIALRTMGIILAFVLPFTIGAILSGFFRRG